MKLKDAKLAFIALQGYNLFRPGVASHIGGAEVQILQLAASLREKTGCSARIVCLGPEDGLENHAGIEVATVSRRRGALGKTRAIQRALEESGADCVLQRSWGLETWLGARYARRHGKRFVFMVAHAWDARPPRVLDWLHWRRAAYRLGLAGADAVVAQSAEQTRTIERNLGIRPVLIRSFQPPPENVAIEEKKNVLWVGRAVPFKRVEKLLDVAERLPGVPFVLVLNPTHDKPYYQDLRARLERLPNVRHVPYVPYEEIGRYFRGARLFIGTSTTEEGFPNTYLQAFRARTPVLSLAVDPDRMIRERELGFVAGENLDALAREVERRFPDAEWIRKTGDRAADYLREFHDPSRLTEQWAELLSGL